MKCKVFYSVDMVNFGSLIIMLIRLSQCLRYFNQMKENFLPLNIVFNNIIACMLCCAKDLHSFNGYIYITWGLREAGRRRLNVFEMKCLRPMVGVTRWDRIMNEEIRRRAGIDETLAEECYDGLAPCKGWMRGAGQERSRQLKWKVNWGEEGLG